MLPVPVGLVLIISLSLLYCLKKLTIRKSQDDFSLVYFTFQKERNSVFLFTPVTLNLRELISLKSFEGSMHSHLVSIKLCLIKVVVDETLSLFFLNTLILLVER